MVKAIIRMLCEACVILPMKSVVFSYLITSITVEWLPSKEQLFDYISTSIKYHLTQVFIFMQATNFDLFGPSSGSM
jgi:hypothetical protein